MDEPQKLTKQEKRQLRREERHEEYLKQHRKKIYTRLLMWVGITAGLTLIIYLMIVAVNPVPPPASLIDPVSAADKIRGNPQAAITLVEYSDFQCPACAVYAPMVKKLLTDNGERVRLIYRYFPLPQHKNGEWAALAAEAAGQQGKFWEMHDLLFENQLDWQDLTNSEALAKYQDYAKNLGLDLAKFAGDLNSEELKNKIAKDRTSGLSAGIDAVPTFFLNGKTIIQPRDYENFKNIVLGG